MSELISSDEIIEVFTRFQQQNPNPQSELKWKNAYTLLVSVVLSAQATDKSVNKATEALYAIADTPEKMLKLGEQSLIGYIRSIGLYRTKARHVIELSRLLVENFDGTVPETREALQTLPGVGRKTANVVLNVAFGQPTMPVDTHLKRICPKIGLCRGGTVEQIEKDLVARIPGRFMNHAHHWLILHGRYICTARNPKCDICILNDICRHNEW
ncbi:MAG: endonuclease III [Treponema sp.]|jgi:endonuclease-3|nr:endonuclease III [Treponema sp.]